MSINSQNQNPTSSGNLQAVSTDVGTTAVLTALHGIRFGSIEVVIHNGRIVQVERREKVRIDGTA